MQLSNETNALLLNSAPSKSPPLNMLPSSRITPLKKKSHDHLKLNNSHTGIPNYETQHPNLENVVQHDNFSESSPNDHQDEISKTWRFQNPIPSLPFSSKYKPALDNNDDNNQKYSSTTIDSLEGCISFYASTFYTHFKNVLRIPSVTNSTNTKLSATTKSYLMMLVLLFISHMAGKETPPCFY